MLFQHVRMAGIAAAALLLGWQPSVAAESPCNKPNALGVSRVQEVDTSTGPIFGDIQYVHAPTFLADKEVVLTFDDGPFPETTPAILQALAEQCTKATFFYVGRMALKNPDILAEVDAAGETIGTHTWSHADLRKLPGPRALAEIERGISLLQARLGHPIAPFFRFPYLSDPKAEIHYLGGRGFGVFSADVDSWDSHGLTPTAHIINYVMTRLKQQGRGIVLMHDIKHTTAAALPEILRQLKAGGFKIVHLVPKTPATSLAPYDEWARQTIETNDAAALVASNKAPAATTKVAANMLDRNKLLMVAAASSRASLTTAKLVSTVVRSSPVTVVPGFASDAFAGLVPPPATDVVQAPRVDGRAPVSPSLLEPTATLTATPPAKSVVAALEAIPAQVAPVATAATSQTVRLLVQNTDTPAAVPLRLEVPVAVKSIGGVPDTHVETATAPAGATATALASADRPLVVANLEDKHAGKMPGDGVSLMQTASAGIPPPLAQAVEAVPEPAATVDASSPPRAHPRPAASADAAVSPPPSGTVVAVKLALEPPATAPAQAVPAAVVEIPVLRSVAMISGAAPSPPPPQLGVVAAKFAAGGAILSPWQSPSTTVPAGIASRMGLVGSGGVAGAVVSNLATAGQPPTFAGSAIATNNALVSASPPAGTPAPAKSPRLPLDTEIRTASVETDPAVEVSGAVDPKAAARAKAAAKAARLLRRKPLGSIQLASTVATNPLPADPFRPGQGSTGTPRAGTVAAALLASADDAAPAPAKKRPLRALRVAQSGTAWLTSLVKSTGLFDAPTGKK